MTERHRQPETGDLAARIAKAQSSRPGAAAEPAHQQSGLGGAGRAFRLASEFVAAIIVGAAIGIGLDALFGTSPWMLIVFLLMGFAAGVVNVARTAGRMNAPVPADAPVIKDDDDE
jgi:ATP synthase protein I